MKKLVNGIVEFRRNIRPGYRETFARLALEQSPDALFIACSDSRVAANVFASTEPGDLFVVRNVGNIVPPTGKGGLSESDESEAAAVELALINLNVADVIVCGHSECAAMRALVQGRENVWAPHLSRWLRHGESALARLDQDVPKGKKLEPHNRLSQLNVLQQLEHLKTYPVVARAIEKRGLRLHAWWFDIAHADVYAHDDTTDEFSLIDEAGAARILKGL